MQKQKKIILHNIYGGESEQVMPFHDMNFIKKKNYDLFKFN